MSRLRCGLIINPIAGIGGRVGLKGSDGREIQEKAFQLGAIKEAEGKVRLCLEQLLQSMGQIEFVTASGEMGQSLCEQMGFKHRCIYEPSEPESTTEEDTRALARALVEEGVDIILFAGGDGTARTLLSVVGDEQLCLGIPAGCKIYSGVFAMTPADAGRLIAEMLGGAIIDVSTAQVLDINEQSYREDKVSTRVYGEMLIPQLGALVQAVKRSAPDNEEEILEDIAAYIIERMESDTLYFLGSGSSCMKIKDQLGIEGTLLGVDVILNEELLLKDANEQQLMDLMAEYTDYPVRLVMTIIGGQGMLFGRGNHQICHKVIEQLTLKRTWVIATKGKLSQLAGQALGVDTGNPELNASLAGYVQVITGYEQQTIYPVGRV